MASWQNYFYTPVECLSERSPECDVTRHLVSVNNGCCAAFIMTSLYRLSLSTHPLGLTSRVPAVQSHLILDFQHLNNVFCKISLSKIIKLLTDLREPRKRHSDAMKKMPTCVRSRSSGVLGRIYFLLLYFYNIHISFSNTKAMLTII